MRNAPADADGPSGISAHRPPERVDERLPLLRVTNLHAASRGRRAKTFDAPIPRRLAFSEEADSPEGRVAWAVVWRRNGVCFATASPRRAVSGTYATGARLRPAGFGAAESPRGAPYGGLPVLFSHGRSPRGGLDGGRPDFCHWGRSPGGLLNDLPWGRSPRGAPYGGLPVLFSHGRSPRGGLDGGRPDFCHWGRSPGGLLNDLPWGRSAARRSVQAVCLSCSPTDDRRGADLTAAGRTSATCLRSMGGWCELPARRVCAWGAVRRFARFVVPRAIAARQRPGWTLSRSLSRSGFSP